MCGYVCVTRGPTALLPAGYFHNAFIEQIKDGACTPSDQGVSKLRGGACWFSLHPLSRAKGRGIGEDQIFGGHFHTFPI